MIVLPSIAFGGFSGSAKDVTARQVGGRTILGVRTWPTGPSTNAQIARRSSMAKITKSYKLLTDVEMRSWARLAEHASGAVVLGQKAELSGMNLYVRLNANRAMAVVWSAVWALVIFRDSLTVKNLIGIAFVVLGTVLINAETEDVKGALICCMYLPL